MGGWKLEVFKMGIYMSFPVGLFYYFNQPEFFEKWMMDKRREFFPAEDVAARPMLEEAARKIERRREAQWNAEWEKANSA